MAGDWIKIQHATLDKPEIFRIAESLKIEPDLAFGKCVRFWIWLDQQSENGAGVSVTEFALDRVIGQKKFSRAMIEVGWLEVGPDGKLAIPNFDRHNSKSAKKRALTKNRTEVYRNAGGYERASQQRHNGDASVTPTASLEKRREDNREDLLFGLAPAAGEMQEENEPPYQPSTTEMAYRIAGQKAQAARRPPAPLDLKPWVMDLVDEAERENFPGKKNQIRLKGEENGFSYKASPMPEATDPDQ